VGAQAQKASNGQVETPLSLYRERRQGPRDIRALQ
jgi:hypothetical protein